jgi:hypothetical protein
MTPATGGIGGGGGGGGGRVVVAMADSLSSVDEDDNSLDGGASANGNSRGLRPHHLDTYSSMYHHHHSPTTTTTTTTNIPKVETKARRRSNVRPSYDTEELLNLLHGSDPVRLELTRLENEVRGKDTRL